MMQYKWIGAVLILASCSGFGLSVAASCRREISILRQIIHMTILMESELMYRLTPLPDLCRKVGNMVGGVTGKLLHTMAGELDRKSQPDVTGCMRSALETADRLPGSMRRIFLMLGVSLGQYDLPGQLKGLASVRASGEDALRKLEQNKETRLRSYQTLGLCAGLALVILFI